MAAIHTTTMATTAAIHDLATYPEYIKPLRHEIEAEIAEGGRMLMEMDSCDSRNRACRSFGNSTASRKSRRE